MLKSYVVRAGDHLTKIAHSAGLDADTVWNHEKNKTLREKRADRSILSEGDVIFLPIEEEAPLPLTIGDANRYSVVIPEIVTHVKFANAEGPFANEPYLVEGLDEPVEGTTDVGGGLDITAPVTVRSVKVTLARRGLTFNVLLGDMDPVTETSGVQLRLVALGYLEAFSPGELDESTAEGLRKFQRAKGIAASGMPDDATRDALKSEYGC